MKLKVLDKTSTVRTEQVISGLESIMNIFQWTSSLLPTSPSLKYEHPLLRQPVKF